MAVFSYAAVRNIFLTKHFWSYVWGMPEDNPNIKIRKSPVTKKHNREYYGWIAEVDFSWFQQILQANFPGAQAVILR